MTYTTEQLTQAIFQTTDPKSLTGDFDPQFHKEYNRIGAILLELVTDINQLNDALESFRVYDFDEYFFNTFFENNPYEAFRATFFGNIESYNDEFIRFDAYGNLESLSDFSYYIELTQYHSEIIDAVTTYQDEIDLPEEITDYLESENN